MYNRPLSCIVLATACLWLDPASASSAQQADIVSSGNSADTHTNISQFAPRPSTQTRLDFSTWDGLLKEMVYYGGPSLRQRATRPAPLVGTRFVFGHTSPYRLEGNRIVFERMSGEFKAYIDSYIDDLVKIGNRLDLPALPRDEQLSYWLNLHNALVIQAIAEGYPIGDPSRLKGQDGLPFHDSKRVVIDSVPLSLRNIREDIVYSHWSDPMVIYGFFHGDIGSPSIQRKAFEGTSVHDTLRFSAGEFVNSLRGFHASNGKARLSRHYLDAAPYFFRNRDSDLRAHLRPLMNPETRDEFSLLDDTISFMRHETDIADLTRGDDGQKPYSDIQSTRGLVTGSVSTTLQRAIREQRIKMEKIRARGLMGTVTIEDIETPDLPLPDEPAATID